MKKKELKRIIELLLKENEQLKESLSGKYSEHLNDAVRYYTNHNVSVSEKFEEDIKSFFDKVDSEIRLDTRGFYEWLKS